jgi:hypothetical protein
MRTRQRAIGAFLLALLVAAWFAPAMIARSSLRHRIVEFVLPELRAKTTISQASLGWLSPVVLRGVTLADADGETLLHVEKFETSRSLLSLLIGRTNDVGTLTFTRPIANVKLRPGGSNLEDILEPVFESPGGGSGMTVRVSDGRIAWTKADGTPSSSSFQNLSATIVREAGAEYPKRIDIAGTLSDGEHAGTLAVRSTAAEGAAPQFSIESNDLPLAALQPWLDRCEARLVLIGTATTDLVVAAPDQNSPTWNLNGHVAGRRLRLTRTGYNDEHPLLLEDVTLAGRVTADESHLTFEKLELRSDIGTLTGDGTLAFAALNAGDWWSQAQMLLANDLALNGTADLARLSATLPDNVRLRQPIRSGSLNFEMRASGEPENRRGVLRFKASDVIAGIAVRQIQWREPVSLEVAVRQSRSGIAVEKAQAQSDFLTLTASGSTTNAEIAFATDLDRLRENVSRFVELPADMLAGHVEGRIVVRREASGDRTEVEAHGTARQLKLGLPGRHWSEQHLDVEAAGVCRGRLAGPLTIESGGFTLRSIENDELHVALTSPMTTGTASRWSAAVTAKGDSTRWLSRARAWGMLPAAPTWSIAGTVDASSDVEWIEPRLRATKLKAEVKELRLQVANRVYEESYARLAGEMAWDAASETLAVPTATFTSESAAVNATNVVWPLANTAATAGHFELRGGIGRLARYVLPDQPPVWVSGVVQGTVDLKAEAAATSADARFVFEHPVLTRPHAIGNRVEWRPVWSDERAELSLKGSYRPVSDALDVTELQLKGSGLAVIAHGRIERVSSSSSADLAGSLSYDLAQFAKHVNGWPSDVAPNGTGTKPFVLRGPLTGAGLVDPALSAQAGVGWKSLDVCGITVGPGDLMARLERGSVAVDSIDWPIGQGRVLGSVTLDLNDQLPLHVKPGSIAKDIAVTPEMCRRWLRYATPALADAAVIQGTASLDVVSCVTPLMAPTAMQAEGRLLIAGLEATPGPLATSLIEIVGQVERIAGRNPTRGSDLRLSVPQQNVAVRVVGGRVIHDRFAVRLGDADGPVMATSGSVGFDESLDLVVDVPLDATWFKDERIAAAMKGQSLRVPIHGTLSRPAPDPRALQDLARRAATGAVEGFLNREIEKQVGDPLRKLLDRGGGK